MSKKVNKYILKEELSGKVIGKYPNKTILINEGIGCSKMWFHRNSNEDKTRMVFKGVAYNIINLSPTLRYKVVINGVETLYSTVGEIRAMIGCSAGWYYEAFNEETSTVKFQGVTYTIIDTLKEIQ